MILPPKNIFSKHQNKAEFKNLDDSEVLSSDSSDLTTSTASMTSHACQSNLSIYIINSASRAKILSPSVSNKPTGWNKRLY